MVYKGNTTYFITTITYNKCLELTVLGTKRS